jgi:hypothetical protein
MLRKTWGFARGLGRPQSQILRLPALTQDFDCGLPLGVASLTPRKTAQYKTGAYSPPRFSAPVLKGLPKPGEPGRSSTFGQLVRRAKAGYAKSKKMGCEAPHHQDALRC